MSKFASPIAEAYFTQGPDGVVVLDPASGKILDFNDQVCRQLGYTREEFAYLSVPDLEASESPEEVLRHIRKIQHAGSDRFETRHRTKQGKIRDVHVTAQLVEADSSSIYLCIWRDITDQKRAEEALRERDERLQKQNAVLLTLVSRGSLFQADLQQAIKEITEASSDLIGTERVSVWLFSEDFSDLRCLDLFCRSSRQHKGNESLHSADFPSYIAHHRKGEVIAAENVYTDPRTREIPNAYYQKHDIRSLLDAPVWMQDHPGGILSFEQVGERRTWTPEDERLATNMAALLSLCFEASERKRAEEALRDYQQRLADIIQFLPDATLAIDRNKRVIVWNKAIEEMTGIPASKMLGEGDYAYTVPFYGYRRPQLMDLIFDTTDEVASRYPGINRQGDTLTTEFFCNALYSNRGAWIYAKVAPLYDSDGNVIGAIESLRDISERKRSEEELARATTLLQAAIDQTPAGMLIAEAPGVTIRWANQAALGIRGAHAKPETGIPAELHPLHCHTFWPDGTLVAPEDFPLSRAILKGETVTNQELIIRREDGETRHLLANAAPVRNTNGEVVAGVVVFPDVTELRRSEELTRRRMARRQRESEAIVTIAASKNLPNGSVRELASELTELAACACEVERVGVWLFETGETRLVNVDTYTASNRGHTSGEVVFEQEYQHEFEILKTSKYVDAHDALTDPRTARYAENYLKSHRITSMLDVPIRSGGRNRGMLCFEHVDRAHHWEDDEITFACQLADQVALAITHHERQLAEAEKDQLQAQLIQAQKMESVGRLAGGVAHDFNNMLQAIMGNTALALEDIPADSPVREYLEEAQKCSQRSAELTRQLLTFARKQTIAPKVLNLNETVEGMLKMLRRLIGENIDLAWKPGAELGAVNMDPSQVDQVLANLCVNARDAIGGVGKVTIETANTLVDEAYLTKHPEMQPGTYVRLAVSDNGCGMSPEVRAHLFEPFFTTKGLGQGTGLGLATVYGIVKQNHGFINVYSEPGRGSTFAIHLPAHVTASNLSGERAATTPNHGHETILLVEDEPSILRVSRRMLENLGYRVIAAHTPGEATQLAHEHAGEIHLLMTDVIMPEMNGRDLAKNLLNAYPNLKRLFISGYTADVIAHHGVLDPGVHFLQKPFSNRTLSEKVREALDAE